MTAFSDEECERLIQLIRQNPPIYNGRLDSNKDKNLRENLLIKDNIWINIAESLDKTDSECRKKWKLIKDSYNRYKRKLKHSKGAPPAKNSKWQFYERLRFLENIPSEVQGATSLNEQNTNTSLEVGLEDTFPEDTDESLHNADSNELEHTPGNSNSIPNTSIPQSVSSERNTKKATKRKRQRHNDNFIQLARERQENRNLEWEFSKSQQQADDDLSTFTKHIEVTLRKLSSRSRAMAKNEIFNIVSKYEIEDIDGQSGRPYYTSSSRNSHSPISVDSSEQKPPNEFIYLTPHHLQHISSDPLQPIKTNSTSRCK